MTPKIPLCVDLDGTLIRGDMLVISIRKLIRERPYFALATPFWLMRGRAALKHEIAARVRIDPATLPYHCQFLSWLRLEQLAGRRLVLATASDQLLANSIARYLGIFDEVIGSDGRNNRKGRGKVDELQRRYAGGFDYAGNSVADIPVWRACRQAILVNAPDSIRKRVREMSTVECEFA